MTATSVDGSVPTVLALNSRLSNRRTVTRSAPCTTWLFVRMYPSWDTMKPDPDPCSTWGCRGTWKKSSNPGGRRRLLTCSRRSDLMNTTAGFTCSATDANASPRSTAALACGSARGGAGVLNHRAHRGFAARRQFECRGECQSQCKRHCHQSSELQPVPRLHRHPFPLLRLLGFIVVHDFIVSIDHVFLTTFGLSSFGAPRAPARLAVAGSSTGCSSARFCTGACTP